MRGQTLARRTFWWDRTTDVDVEPLGAVVFDLDAMAEVGEDGELAPRAGLIDLVMSLFVAGVLVGVVSTGRRAEVDPLVRELIGDGLVETIVTGDDTDSGERTDLYALALWEFDVEPESALAVVGSSEGWRAANDAGLASVAASSDYSAESDLISAAGCERIHRRWWTTEKRAA